MVVHVQIEALKTEVPSLSVHVAHEVPYMQSPVMPLRKGWRVATEQPCLSVQSGGDVHSVDRLYSRTS